jgi:hypothetical protein
MRARCPRVRGELCQQRPDERAEMHGCPMEETQERPIDIVRFGIGKELQLYRDRFVVLKREEADTLEVPLENIRRLLLAPGTHVPSKLLLMLELTDGETIVAADGMSNVKDFRHFLVALREAKPDIQLDPADMDEQLEQALINKRRAQMGCYLMLVVAVTILFLVYVAIAVIGARHPAFNPGFYYLAMADQFYVAAGGSLLTAVAELAPIAAPGADSPMDVAVESAGSSA